MRNKTIIPFITSIILTTAVLSACADAEGNNSSTADNSSSNTNSSSTTEITESNYADIDDNSEIIEATENVTATKSSSVSVYFSRVGNTDFPQNADAVSSASLNLKDSELKGNAQLIAEWIADEAECETFEIITSDKYPVDYDATVEDAHVEQNKGERPELTDMPDDLSSYDTVWLTFPNWWGDLPMPVYSFFDRYDFSGKNIVVFVTHEGSSFSNTINKIKELEPDANIVKGLSVRGGAVNDNESEIREWVKDNK